ncbi:hypothetical protein R1sor_007514 [Riccia sorocarpa]|uniref:Uncharacterized protein n=1 Tax=Riccia sorocarpa TaxID=122646 RepID=A0ABD3HQZ6_9MARC
MVEHVEDSRGPSAVLKGDELQRWMELSCEWDLFDCWLNSAERTDPWYTRHAVRGGRIEQARLDRVYLSRNGAWVNHVQKVDHFGGKTLSDHIPVVANLQGKSERTGEEGGGATVVTNTGITEQLTGDGGRAGGVRKRSQK